MLEKQVIGACLLDESATDKVMTSLTEEYFTYLRPVFKVMSQLYKAEKAIDIPTLSANIEFELLKDIISQVTTSAYIDNHILQLKERKHLKDLEIFTRELNEKIRNQDIKEIHNFLSAIPQMEEDAAKHKNTKDIIQDTINDVAVRMNAKDDIRGLRTGYSNLDRMICGLKDSELITLEADPNVGKSLLALNIACNIASRGERVDFFAYEMSNKQIGFRITPSLVDVNISSLSNPKKNLTKKDLNNISKFEEETLFNNLHVYSDELTANTVTEIKTKVNKTSLTHNNKPKLIIVDYLQLLESDGEEWERAGNNSHKLKKLAKRLNVPILLIVSKAKDGSIRGSGQIQFDIDQRWELIREHDSEDPIQQMVTQLKVKKNRDGGKGIIDMTYIKERLVFKES
ncbi:MAG: hypothetical protein N4A63_13770 [Vallitalea sp.]|jgi:replicative DNA helicase|nr:hypothetical protein [Vallitalea sp.]